MSKINVRVRDHSDEYSSVSILVSDLLDADPFSTGGDLADAFASHIQALSIGTVVIASFSQETQAKDDTRPASQWAQRELGLRFYLRDNVADKLGYVTVPCADLGTVVTVEGTDLLDLSAAPVATFVTWLEANAKSDAGNAVTVEKAIVVGRNS